MLDNLMAFNLAFKKEEKEQNPYILRILPFKNLILLLQT